MIMGFDRYRFDSANSVNQCECFPNFRSIHFELARGDRCEFIQYLNADAFFVFQKRFGPICFRAIR